MKCISEKNNECTKCGGKYYLYLGECRDNCPDKTFKNKINLCESCELSCSNCDGNTNKNCTE